MNYFSNCTDFDEAKKRYRQLALINHPDRGGDTANMQEINIQYAKYLKRTNYDFKNYRNDYGSDEIFRDFEELIKNYPDAAMKVIFGGIAIDLSFLFLKILTKK